MAWAAHGSANFRQADQEYRGTIELLLAAGAQLEPAVNRFGEPPDVLASPAVAGFLRARGFVRG